MAEPLPWPLEDSERQAALSWPIPGIWSSKTKFRFLIPQLSHRHSAVSSVFFLVLETELRTSSMLGKFSSPCYTPATYPSHSRVYAHVYVLVCVGMFVHLCV